MKIILSEENQKDLVTYLQEIPFKYAQPVLALLNSLAAEQSQKTPEAKVETKPKTTKPKA